MCNVTERKSLLSLCVTELTSPFTSNGSWLVVLLTDLNLFQVVKVTFSLRFY